MLAVIALLPLIGAPADATSLIVQDFPAAAVEVPVPGPLAVGETVPPASDETLSLETDGMTAVRGTSVAVTDLAEVARSSGVGGLGPMAAPGLRSDSFDDAVDLASGCAEPVSSTGIAEESVPVAIPHDCADYVYSHEVAEDGLGFEVTACRLQREYDRTITITGGVSAIIEFGGSVTYTETVCVYHESCGGLMTAVESQLR